MANNADDTHIKEIQGRYGVANNHVFIDIGYEWAETVQMCARNQWWGVKGEGQKKSFVWGNGEEKLYSKRKIAQGKSGTKAYYISLASDPIKDILFNLMNGNGLEWTIPNDVPKSYHNHMRAEVKEEAPVGKRQELQATWVTKNRQNHLFDAEYYNVAAALIFGIFGE